MVPADETSRRQFAVVGYRNGIPYATGTETQVTRLRMAKMELPMELPDVSSNLLEIGYVQSFTGDRKPSRMWFT